MTIAKKATIKAILFDKDGTLIDFNGTWHALYKSLALEVANNDEAHADHLMHIGGFNKASNSFAAGSELAAGTTPGIVRLWLPNATADEFAFWRSRLDKAFIEEGPVAAVPVVGLHETIDVLYAAGIMLAVVTNDLEQSAENTLVRFGIRDKFVAVLGYDSVANPKPHAEPVHKFCQENGLTPDQVLVIGDNSHDIEMARNAGAGYAIGVLTGTGTHEVLSQDSDVVLASIAELPAWLGIA
jgi:phosphoglycolate phosphatase